MSPADKNELMELLWALCDQSIEPQQHARLEQMLSADVEARRIYALYTGMVQRLDWDRVAHRGGLRNAAQPRLNGVKSKNGSSSSVKGDAKAKWSNPRSSQRRWASCVLLVLATAACVAIWINRLAPPLPSTSGSVSADLVSATFSAATLTAAEECRWSDGSLSTTIGSRLPEGRLSLEQGVAEITFDQGTKVLLEGPAVFEVKSQTEAILHSGKLLAVVSPEGHSFSLQTPRATIVESGRECGVISRERGTEVFAFRGSVSVHPRRPWSRGNGEERLAEGETLRITDSLERTTAIGRTPFVRGLPPRPNPQTKVAKMRELVSAHPALLHHFTFEGDRYYKEHLKDKKGEATLREFAYGAGSSMRIRYQAGLDDSTVAFTPHRAGPTSGGAALQTRDLQKMPPRLTVECLVQPSHGFGPGYAVCMRHENERGYFVRTSDRGPYLGAVIGNKLQEIKAPMRYVPGHWYYVATTCERQEGTTLVSFYIADISAGQSTLTRVGDPAVLSQGTYPTETDIRIGMGEFSSRSPGFLFSGAIDEVAIYGDVLPPVELEKRLKLLIDDSAARDGTVLIRTIDDQ